MVELSIIIVNYNAKDFLQDCLESIRKYIPKEITYEVIIIDNASKDKSVEMLKSKFPEFSLIVNTNEGFSKANNRGVKVAKGEYLLFLNPDTVVYEHTIKGMLTFMREHPACGAATCRLEMLNGKIDYACHRGFPTPWNSFCYFSGLTKMFPQVKLFSGYTLGWEDMNKVHEIDALAGAFMLVSKKVGESVGWWDEDYFFNGEDIDFCYRIKQNGWKIYYVPTFSIRHYNGISGGTKKNSSEITTATLETKRFIHNTRFDAMKIFYKKHYQDNIPSFIGLLVNAAIEYKRRKTLLSL